VLESIAACVIGGVSLRAETGKLANVVSAHFHRHHSERDESGAYQFLSAEPSSLASC